MTEPTIPEQQPTDVTPPATGTVPGQQAGDTKPAGKTFTEAEVSAMVRDRLDKYEASLLTKLGVSNLDDAKKATTRLKEIEDAQKTETQRLQEQLTARDTALATAQAQARKTAIENAALKALTGQVAPDRLNAAIKLLDTSKLTIGEDGLIAGMSEAVKLLLDENTFLKPEQPAAPAKPTVPSISATNPAGTSNQPDTSWHPLKRNPAIRLGGGGIVTSKE